MNRPELHAQSQQSPKQSQQSPAPKGLTAKAVERHVAKLVSAGLIVVRPIVPVVIESLPGERLVLAVRVGMRAGELVWGVLASHPRIDRGRLVELASLEVREIETDREHEAPECWVPQHRAPHWCVGALPHVLAALGLERLGWRIVGGTESASALWAIERRVVARRGAA